MIALGYVPGISYESVRQLLKKKMSSNPGASKSG